MMLRPYNLELELYRDSKDFKQGVKLAQEVKQFFEKHKTRIPPDYQLLLNYQFAFFYFMLADYQHALTWLNEILRRNFGSVREHLQSYSQLLNLIIHFELGNTIVLKYAVNSCQRLFPKISMVNKGKYPALLEKFRADIFAGMDGATIKNTFDYFDFRAWLDAK